MANWKDLTALLQGFVDGAPNAKGKLPGCGIQITQHGETIYEGYFGWSDIENKVPVTSASLFRQASLSKLPLYTTAMILYEQGRFLLSDPIWKYLPEWKNTRKYMKTPNGHIEAVPTDGPITVRDCLSMKCGLPYCNFPGPTNDRTMLAMQKAMEPLWKKGHYTNREHVAAMASVPLAFEPGTHWLYGFSSELTAALIEAVCGKPIDDVFEELLFGPLGMNNTRSHYFGDAENRIVKLYQRGPAGELVTGSTKLDDKLIPGPEHEAGWSRLISTVNDYSKLLTALANGGVYQGVSIIGRKTIDLARFNGLDAVMQKDFDNLYLNGYGYGYGFRTLIDKAKGNCNASLGTFGWTGGFGTWAEADPEDGVAVTYMHNLLPSEEEYFHLLMRNVAFGCIE